MIAASGQESEAGEQIVAEDPEVQFSRRRSEVERRRLVPPDLFGERVATEPGVDPGSSSGVGALGREPALRIEPARERLGALAPIRQSVPRLPAIPPELLNGHP